MTSGTKLAIGVLVVVLAAAAYLYSQVRKEIAHQDCMANRAVATSSGAIAPANCE